MLTQSLPIIFIHDAACTGSKGPPEITPFSKSKLADLPQFGMQQRQPGKHVFCCIRVSLTTAYLECWL